jgi:hypothetical protein
MPAGPPPTMQQRTVLDEAATGGRMLGYPGPGGGNPERTATI